MEISMSGSGEGPGWATAPGYSTSGVCSTSSSIKCPEEMWSSYEHGRIGRRGRSVHGKAGSWTDGCRTPLIAALHRECSVRSAVQLGLWRGSCRRRARWL